MRWVLLQAGPIKNIVLTPSGTGNTVLNGNVGVGRTNPAVRLDARASSGEGAIGIGTTSATASNTGIDSGTTGTTKRDRSIKSDGGTTDK